MKKHYQSQSRETVYKFYLAKVPVFPVKYCRHPSGPPFSSPHSYCVTFISHDLEVDPDPPRVKRALLHWSLASKITAEMEITGLEKVNKEVVVTLIFLGCHSY